MVADMKSLVSKSIRKPEAKDISCDRSHKNYDFCTISGPTVLDPTSSTFYVMDPKKAHGRKSQALSTKKGDSHNVQNRRGHHHFKPNNPKL